MPERLPEDIRATLARLDALIADTLTPLQQRLDADTLATEPARLLVIDAARDAGLFGIPQQSAPGPSPLLLVALRERLAATGLQCADWVLGPPPGLLAHCEGEAAERFLTPFLNGRLRTGFGFTEPKDAPPTVARFDGDSIRVDGEKSYITGGMEAGLYLIVAQGRDADDTDIGPCIVLVPRETPGVTISRSFESLDGGRHAAVLLRDVRVPSSWTVGAPGRGMPRAMQQIADTRLLIAARATGLLCWLHEWLEAELTRARPRGEPLAARDGIRIQWGELQTRMFAARSMLYRTAHLAHSLWSAGSTDTKTLVNEGMMVKLYTTELVGAAVDTAIQWIGGDAVVSGHPLERLYREVRVLRLAEGASDTLRMNIARGRFDYRTGRI